MKELRREGTFQLLESGDRRIEVEAQSWEKDPI
jgi:hypothetical protein